jgi:hypothetical protein
LKLKSEILKDKNGITISIEEFVYNDFGLLTKQIFKDNLGNLKYYKAFEYDEKENCIKATDFSNDNQFQRSFEYTYDTNNNQIKTIERTVDGSIYDWTEVIEQPENNLKIWLAMNSEGKIIHRTVENLLDHSEKRFNDQGILYENHYKKFDSANRLMEKLITDNKGKEKEKHLYQYEGQKEIWKYILNGSLVKTEERVYDNNKNLTHYIRKDSNGKCLEWYGFELDKFGNKIKYYWGQEEGKQIGFKTVELIYDNND